MSSPPSPSRATVRLSDQALVAVHLARALAGSRTPNVGHLIAGLVAEPEGRAGLRIRAASGESHTAALPVHPGLSAPMPSLATALIALPVDDAVAWTDDLAAAAVRVGGQDLRDLLDHAGVAIPDDFPLRSRPQPEDVLEGAETETFGRGTFIARGFDDRADRAIASARAAGETSASLLPWLELGADVRRDYNGLPEVSIKQVVEQALDMRDDPPLGLAAVAGALVRVAIRQATGQPPRPPQDG